MPRLCKRKNTNNTKGFSLVEVLITVTVLTLGLTAITIVMVSNIRSLNEAKNQVVASILAQEALELTLNLHENNPTFRSNSGMSGQKVIDISKKYSDLANSGDRRLYIKNNDFYMHDSSGQASKYYRYINITNEAAAGRVKVESYVWWTVDGSFPGVTECKIAKKCITLSTFMSD